MTSSNRSLNPLNHPVCLDFPVWYRTTAWGEHIPFALYIVSALRPKCIVELGTYYGTSYFAFCQAVKTVGIEAKCYAVDTWEGDEHAGEIESEILSELQSHNNEQYGDFSVLVQSTFDDALEHFEDGSVDLLHIDGFHTYEAVSHDFETWKPKLSESGVVLFHDINVRERGFGVWKFWQELSQDYKTFEFHHGHGLGVLSINAVPSDLETIFEPTDGDASAIRKFFHSQGAAIDAVNKYHEQNEYISYLKTFESLVRKSKLMRAYRVLKFEGPMSLLSKFNQNRE